MRNTLVLAVVGLLACGTALADLSGLSAWTDPNGYTWSGTSGMSQEKTGEPNTFLSGDVEWVVEYVAAQSKFKYTYQIESTGDYGITLLGVPMLSSNEAETIGAYQVEVGNIAPADYNFTNDANSEPTLAWWSFSGLTNGQVSYGLTYWSVNMPLTLGGYIQDGGLFAANGDLPSPSNVIPEPITLAVLALGVGLLVRRGKK